MASTQRDTSVTDQEVLDAVNSSTVYTLGDKTHWTQSSAMDIAEFIAKERGFEIQDRQYASRASTGLRNYVTPGQVKKALVRLSEAGKIKALPGDHAFLRRVYGINSTATYYMSHDSYAMAKEEQQKVDSDAQHANAEKWATSELVRMYPDEHRNLRVKYVHDHPTPEYED
jgi:hypothetical protein